MGILVARCRTPVPAVFRLALACLVHECRRTIPQGLDSPSVAITPVSTALTLSLGSGRRSDPGSGCGHVD